MARTPGDLRPKWEQVARLMGLGQTMDAACETVGIASGSIRSMLAQGHPRDREAWYAVKQAAADERLQVLSAACVDRLIAEVPQDGTVAVAKALEAATRHGESAWRREHDRKRLKNETRVALAKLKALAAGISGESVVVVAPDPAAYDAWSRQVAGSGADQQDGSPTGKAEDAP